MIPTPIKRFLFLLIFTPIWGTLWAQNPLDSLRFGLNQIVSISADSTINPLYQQANRNGLFPINGPSFITAPYLELPYHRGNKIVDFTGGLTFVNDAFNNRNFIQFGYAGIKIWDIELKAGRFEQAYSEEYRPLSTGSLVYSNNILPIPRVYAGIPEFTSVPFTQGYLEVKGGIAHGQLEEDRHISNAYTHEKYLYVKAGGDFPIRLGTGVVHLALWGGTHPDGRDIPQSFSDYMLIFFGTEAQEGSGLGGEEMNALGAHLGIFDFFTEVEFSDIIIKAYYQLPFEDTSGFPVQGRNRDFLIGSHIDVSRKNPWVQHILFEAIHTAWQSGPGIPDPLGPWADENFGHDFGGRDDYYNNYFYRSGRTYQGRIIGTPLMMTRQVGRRLFPELNTYSYDAIVNNRIYGGHIGLQGLLNTVSYRFLGSFTRNLGTYTGLYKGRYSWDGLLDPDPDYPFTEGLNQFYFLLEGSKTFDFSIPLELSLGLSVDAGQMNNNIGAILSLKWMMNRNTFKKSKQ